MRRLPVLALSVMLLGLGGIGQQAEADDVVVFAAASLRNALDEIVEAWSAAEGGTTAISYAASSALARQIEEGAPADIFMSADLDWMDYLAERDLIREDTRTELLGNRIVLVAPADSDATVTIEPGFDLVGLLDGGRLAMGETSSVPAGRYGRAALESLGVWDSVSGSLAEAENVRAALLLVSRGEAPLGIVYETDAAADEEVIVLDRFPEDTHPPIIYPVAITATSANEAAAGLLAFLTSDAAEPIFVKHGFTVLD